MARLFVSLLHRLLRVELCISSGTYIISKLPVPNTCGCARVHAPCVELVRPASILASMLAELTLHHLPACSAAPTCLMGRASPSGRSCWPTLGPPTPLGAPWCTGPALYCTRPMPSPAWLLLLLLQA
jgi:hypothetical protein